MCIKALVLTSVLAAGSLAAADALTPLELAIPGAPIVGGMNFERIRLAYAGSRYQELLTPEYREQSERSWKQMRDMLGVDLSQLKDVVFSMRPVPPPGKSQVVVILRGPFDPDHPPAFLAFLTSEKSVYQGVPIFATKPGQGGEPMTIAFPGAGMALVGDPASVRATIDRWKSGSASHSPLLAKAEEMSAKFHVWFLARDFESAASPGAPVPAGGAGIDAALRSVGEATLGMNLVPAFEASVEMVTKTAKDASGLEGAVKGFVAVATAQAAAKQNKDLFSGLHVESQDRTVRVSLVIPEEKMIEAFKEQMKRGPNWWKDAGQAFGLAPQNTDVVIQSSGDRHATEIPKNANSTHVVTLSQ